MSGDGVRVGVAARLLAGGLAVTTAVAIATFGRIARAARRHSHHHADAVVVFGAEATAGGPSAELRARLDHSIELFGEGRAPVVVCCGGRSGDIDETEVMANHLVAAGVPADRVVRVAGSTTRTSVASIAACNYRSVLMVTSPYHTYRVLAEARRQGIVAHGCPAPTTPEQADSTIRLLRTSTELVASGWYALPKAFTTRIPTGPNTVRHRVPTAVLRQVQRRRQRSVPLPLVGNADRAGRTGEVAVKGRSPAGTASGAQC